MCELFGMSSRVPTSVRLSIRTLARHGGAGHGPGDGWGVAFHDGRDALIYREPEPAGDSPWLPFLEQRPLGGSIILAHIRHATRDGVVLRNTRPFQREREGQVHVFAHNGNLPGIERLFAVDGRFRPVGDTDSEIAFCSLLNRLAPPGERHKPSMEDRTRAVASFAAELRPFGPANFLYTDGDLLFAHAGRRTQMDGRIVPPGLVMLERTCPADRDALPAAGIDIAPGAPEAPQHLILFASVPLTDEDRRPLAQRSLTVARRGEVLSVF